jgi:hypothetical protein
MIVPDTTTITGVCFKYIQPAARASNTVSLAFRNLAN